MKNMTIIDYSTKNAANNYKQHKHTQQSTSLKMKKNTRVGCGVCGKTCLDKNGQKNSKAEIELAINGEMKNST